MFILVGSELGKDSFLTMECGEEGGLMIEEGEGGGLSPSPESLSHLSEELIKVLEYLDELHWEYFTLTGLTVGAGYL